MDNGTRLLTGCSLSLLGFGVATYAAGALRTELAKRGTWDQMETVITELGKTLDTDSNGNERVSYFPVYRYHYRGQDDIGRSSFTVDEPNFTVGTRIVIVVNPQNPTQNDVLTDQTKLVLAWSILFVGVILVAIGATLAGMAFLRLIGVIS